MRARSVCMLVLAGAVALPVRQAVVRSAQIQNKYEQMNPDQKKAFDASADRYLNAPMDTIVGHVLYGCNVQIYEREMARVWPAVKPARRAAAATSSRRSACIWISSSTK